MPKAPRRRRIRRGAAEPFQPLHTMSQILALQSLYYLSATLLMLFTTLVAGRPFSMVLIFSWRAVRADTAVGWTLGVVWMLVSLIMFVPVASPLVFKRTLIGYHHQGYCYIAYCLALKARP